jgi:hypothetical protein
MSKRRRTPEEREELRQLLERGRAARENMQAIIDRQDARLRVEAERRERRRRLLRRIFPFGRAA